MRIGFLSQEYPPFGPTGGIGSYSSVIAPALVDRGHEVHVVSCHGRESRDAVRAGVHVHVRPRRRIPLIGSLARISQTHDRLASARSAARALAGLGEFDVIESPEWMAEALFLRGPQRRKLVIHLHTSVGLIAHYGDREGRDARLANALEMAGMRNAAAITSPSRLLLEAMEKRGAIKQSDGVVIRLPVDLSQPPPETRPPSWRIVVVVGRLERRKGIDTLIEALAGLRPPLDDTKLIAVGRSSGVEGGAPYAVSLERLAERHGVDFEHKPQLTRAELALLYPQARVVAVPSRFESFSVTALEAMAAGIPVVCTRTCGVAELIAGSEAGAVVPPADPVALREALVPFLEDRDRAEAAGDAGRALVEATCAPSVVAAQREELYKAVVAGEAHRRARS